LFLSAGFLVAGRNKKTGFGVGKVAVQGLRQTFWHLHDRAKKLHFLQTESNLVHQPPCPRQKPHISARQNISPVLQNLVALVQPFF
jgi:hypothetical protein